MMGGTSLKGDSLKVLLDALLEKQEDGEQGEVKYLLFSANSLRGWQFV